MLLGVWTSSFAQQNYTIEGQIYPLSNRKIYISSYFGEKTLLIDSTVLNDKGRFTIQMKPGALTGMYRLSWGKDKFMDLIWNKENIAFSTYADYPADSLKIQSSVENKIFQYYIQIDRLNQQKLDLLMPVIDYYPQTDLFYSRTIEEFEAIQKNQTKLLDSLSRLYPSSFAVRIFKTQEPPFLPASLSKEERLNYLKLHFFDHVNFQDTLLLNSSVWANKAISYLSLYGNSKLDQKQLEAEFIKAVTILFSAAAINAEVYKFLLDYTVGGFDKYHFDGVITYIADNFQDPFSCEDQARKTVLQKKLDNFKKISIGKVAPDIIIPDIRGKMIRLSAIQSEFTLVIFWSSECGHCREMMPKVKQMYESQKTRRIEIMSVSLDTSRTEWTTFLKEEKPNWINASELKGFNSTSADDYNIYATPTMFLLDREKKILAKPVSYRELEQALRENKLL